jgi:hypothetical protein
METLAVLRDTVRERRGSWLCATAAFVVLYYLGLLITVILRLGHLPNYATFYDWPANVWTIIRSTPSPRDMPPIIAREWLFETGYLNMSYGHGVAVWSLAIVPAKVASVALLGALAATSLLLLRRLRAACPMPLRGAWSAALRTFAPAQDTYPNGCHVCEVEIDPATGAVEIVAYAVVDDVGTVINPKTLKGQIHGGVAQGAGQALMEAVAAWLKARGS